MPLLVGPVPSCAFCLPHAGTPSLYYPRPHYYHPTSYNITATDIDMRATEDKTSCLLLLAIDICTLLFPIPHPDPDPIPIPCPALPYYALALFVRVHLGQDETVTLQRESDDSPTPGHNLRRYIASTKSLGGPDCIFSRATGPLPCLIRGP